MKKSDSPKPATLRVSEESLRKTMQEGTEPSVEQLTFALNKSEATIRQLKIQLGQAAEAYKDMQLRLATTEFQHRLEFLWKVMFTDGAPTLFGRDFITKCAEEFKEMMFPTIPIEQEAHEKKEQDA